MLLPALGWVVFAVSHALLGQITMIASQPVPGGVVAVHVAVAAWWIGGVLPLAWAVQREDPAAASLVEALARSAAVTVPATAPAGLVLSAYYRPGCLEVLHPCSPRRTA